MKNSKHIIGGLVVAIIGLVILFTPLPSEANHDIMESAGDPERIMVRVYTIEMKTAIQDVGEAQVMKGAMKFVQDLIECASFWGVATEVMKQAADAGQIPREMVAIVQHSGQVTANQLNLYAVALQEHRGIEKFNASSFIHSAEKIGNNLVPSISEELMGPNAQQYLAQRVSVCMPIHTVYVDSMAQIQKGLSQGLTPEQIVPEPEATEKDTGA